MATPAERWDERFRQGRDCPAAEPAAILREILTLLPRGRALDLAMGSGANSLFLAELGWGVTGIDFSRAALEKAEALACDRGLPVAWPEPRARSKLLAAPGSLLLVLADLERNSLPVAQFDVVLCFRYLQRSLFASMERALRAGGVLVFETYTLDQLLFREGPQNRHHLLQPGELRAAFPGLEVLFYREHCTNKAIATLVAKKPHRAE